MKVFALWGGGAMVGFGLAFLLSCNGQGVVCLLAGKVLLDMGREALWATRLD